MMCREIYYNYTLYMHNIYYYNMCIILMLDTQPRYNKKELTIIIYKGPMTALTVYTYS